MADPGWWRHLGQRSRTPDVNPDESLPADQISRSPRRLRPSAAVRRVSSLLSLPNMDTSNSHGERRHNGNGLSHSPSSSIGGSPKVALGDNAVNSTADSEQFHHQADPPESPNGYDDGIDVPEAERTWYNPTVHQMIERLQVAMMTKRDALQPLPIRFNSHILALTEGYSKMRHELAQQAQKIAEVQDLRERELEQFRAMSDEWLIREQGYQAEIKRLELQLAATERGMEAVVVARSSSLVDRGATARKRFEERVKRLSASKVTDDDDDSPSKKAGLAKTASCHKTIASMPRVMDPDKDRLLSEQLEPSSHRARHKKLKHRRPSRGAQPPEPDLPPQDNTEGRATYVPRGAPPTSRRPANVEVPAHYHAGYDDSPTSSSASLPDPKGKGVADSDESLPDLNGKGVEQYGLQTLGQAAGDYLAQPRERLQAIHDDRRFSFAAGEDDTLPVTPAAATGPDGDGATDKPSNGTHFTPRTGMHPQNWPFASPEPGPTGYSEANPGMGALESPVPRKTDSSSSRATVVRTSARESSRSPVTAQTDSGNSDQSRAAYEEETARLLAELLRSRLDAQSLSAVPLYGQMDDHDITDDKASSVRNDSAYISGGGSSRQSSIQSRAYRNPEVGSGRLGVPPPNSSAAAHGNGRPVEGTGRLAETFEKMMEGNGKIMEGNGKIRHGVRVVDTSPSPSAVRGRPTAPGSSSMGRGRGGSPHVEPESPTFTPGRTPSRLPTRSRLSSTSSRTTSSGPTSPGRPTPPKPQGNNGGTANNAAQIAAALAIARGRKRSSTSSDGK